MSLSSSVQSAEAQAVASGDDPSGAAEEELRRKLAEWQGMLAEGGPASLQTQRLILADLSEAMDDPEQRRVLEANGIDAKTLGALEAGAADPSKFSAETWNRSLESLSEGLGSDSAMDVDAHKARLSLVERELGIQGAGMQTANEEMERLQGARDALSAAASSDTPTTLSQDQVDALRAGGFTAGDTSNTALQQVLNGADPSTVEFTPEELSGVVEEINTELSSMEGDMRDQLLELQRLQDQRMALFDLISTQLSKVHEQMMKMADKIGQS